MVSHYRNGTWSLGLMCLIVSCTGEKAGPAVQAPVLHNIEIAIAGMHCDGCASTVSEALKQTDGVVDCRVAFDEKKAIVTFDPTRVDPAELAKVIEKTGYRPTLPGQDEGAANTASPVPAATR